MSQIIIEINEGAFNILTDPNAEVLIIDWDEDPYMTWSYDHCEALIREVLASDLDGPTQFELIERIITRFRTKPNGHEDLMLGFLGDPVCGAVGPEPDTYCISGPNHRGRHKFRSAAAA